MRSVALLFFITVAITTSYGQRSFQLYPNTIPGSIETPHDYKETTDENGYVRQVSRPTLTVYSAEQEKANGSAVIICPGGGYEIVVATDEGADVAKAFTKIGVTAFVLKYRLPSDEIMINKSTGPLQDAQQAIALVRNRANEFQLNPNKIGIVGLSAGGHLASTAGTHFDHPVSGTLKNIDVRPDFMILVYPVISFGSFGAPRSRANLIGKSPSDSLVTFFSNEEHVTELTSPTFLIHAADDKVVSVQNSLMFYNALLKFNVKSELHIVQHGGHGFGMSIPDRNTNWLDWCAEWMRLNGF